jgi:hypothetical protein
VGVRATAIALCAALLVTASACSDAGVIGSFATASDSGAPSPGPGCEPACDEGELCDEARGVCVPCSGDECAPPVDAGECIGAACEACDDDEQCGEDAPVCSEGRCVPCEESSDCDGSGDLECEEGRCVEAEDDDDEEASPADDDNGGSGDDLPGDL